MQINLTSEDTMIEHQVKQLLSQQFGVEEKSILPTSHIISDLGADSLDIVEIVMALESKFKIQINEGEYEDQQTVQQIIDLVNKKIAEK